ncbi:hypothetical protein [Clostridium paraputrificum]|uniref:hypothetical protein n=1 Tax=Clostridium paraputrificum TaxID=29363 RepID=UPI002FCD86D9
MSKNKKYILLILMLAIIITIPKLYNNIKKSIKNKEIVEYINSDEYKERRLKEEREKNKYKYVDPFLDMDIKYIGYTKWGMWDKYYEDHGGVSFSVYLWLSDTEVYNKNYNKPMTRINYHKCKIGEPKIEKEIHVMRGKRNKEFNGCYVPEYYEEITDIIIYNKDGSINEISRY